MGVVDMQRCGGGSVNGGRTSSSWGFRNLVRKKQVDSVRVRRDGHLQLARKLSAFDLIAIGNPIKNFLAFHHPELGFGLWLRFAL